MAGGFDRLATSQLQRLAQYQIGAETIKNKG
jgi:hypothetical protein